MEADASPESNASSGAACAPDLGPTILVLEAQSGVRLPCLRRLDNRMWPASRQIIHGLFGISTSVDKEHCAISNSITFYVARMSVLQQELASGIIGHSTHRRPAPVGRRRVERWGFSFEIAPSHGTTSRISRQRHSRCERIQDSTRPRRIECQ